ncbi:hypothetical protein [Metapseudomonas furukawaii]
MRRIFLSLFLLLSQACAVAETGYSEFSGNWIAVQGGSSNDGTPYSTFEVSLSVEEEKIIGSYCYVTRYGAKIDCDPEEENIYGVINAKTGVATVDFNSSFGAKGGVANLSIRDNVLVWQVIRQPIGGEYYGPNFSTLKATGN